MQEEQDTKALSLTFWRVQPKELVWTVGLVTASVIAPAILAHTSQNQWITGTLVNAVLFLAAWRLNLVNASLVAILPSSVALLRGLLPAPMALIIPYIIASNIVLIAIFSLLRKRMLVGVVLASLAKFLLLFSVTVFLVSRMNEPLVAMFQFPQLITALAGGLLALGLIKKLEK